MSVVENYVMNNPLALLFCNEAQISEANGYLPFSTGFEIECGHGEKYDLENFKKIPHILDVNNDLGEQRYRIKSGSLGLLTLFHISNQLKYNSALQDSGIHYHVDCNDIKVFLKVNNIKSFEDYVLKELDTWNYKGGYNSREFSSGACWFRINDSFNTLEFRIGEMTFDYKVLVERIIHVNKIVKHIKFNLTKKINYTFEKINVQEQVEYLKNTIDDTIYQDYKKQIDKYNSMKISPKKVVNNRVINI